MNENWGESCCCSSCSAAKNIDPASSTIRAQIIPSSSIYLQYLVYRVDYSKNNNLSGVPCTQKIPNVNRLKPCLRTLDDQTILGVHAWLLTSCTIETLSFQATTTDVLGFASAAFRQGTPHHTPKQMTSPNKTNKPRFTTAILHREYREELCDFEDIHKASMHA